MRNVAFAAFVIIRTWNFIMDGYSPKDGAN